MKTKAVLAMEELLINNNGGQPYGFIVYRTKLPQGAKVLEIEKYRDRAQVNGAENRTNILRKSHDCIPKMARRGLVLHLNPK